MSGEIRGQDDGTAGLTEFNAQAFLVQQMLNRINTATVVKVVKCSNNGGISAVGTVDVQPLVNQIDADGNPTEHGIVYGLPYFRLQGGQHAVVLDPQEGDLGIAVFAQHDVSTVAATKDKGNPGSYRKFSMSDGLYLGGVLNGTPSTYLQFKNGAITLNSDTSITLNADTNISVTANARVSVTGSQIVASAATVSVTAASVTITAPSVSIN